jgi:hypothetical protein
VTVPKLKAYFSSSRIVPEIELLTGLHVKFTKKFPQCPLDPMTRNCLPAIGKLAVMNPNLSHHKRSLIFAPTAVKRGRSLKAHLIYL